MIFNEVKQEKYYILEKKAILEEHKNKIYMILQDKEHLKSPMITSNYMVYIGTDLLRHPALNQDGTLREATDKELIEKGIYKLSDLEVLVGDTAKMIYEFPIPEHMVKPVFNKEKLEWEETATQLEIEEHTFKQSVIFYNKELEFASKATAELACDIITQEAYADVKSYMQNIDPYSKPIRSKMEFKINRPSVFDRYQ